MNRKRGTPRAAVYVLVVVAASCSDGTDGDALCASFGLVPDHATGACVCPEGTLESAAGTGCDLPDGGFTPFPDAGAMPSDAGGDASTEHDATVDASPELDAGCAEEATHECTEGSNIGECSPGFQTCREGTWGACEAIVTPVAEVCDGLDNDCDTIVDGPAASASCGNPSRATGSVCSAGSCIVTSCSAGFLDCDMDFENGCEAELGTESSCGGCGDVCGWACDESSCDDAIAIAGGGNHTCAAQASGRVHCWGTNLYGQIGTGIVDGRRYLIPTPVVGVADATQLSAGYSHSCARLGSGRARCWGQNDRGQLGDGSSVDRGSPVDVGLSNVAQVRAGFRHTCAILTSGSLYCWGDNQQGQIGDGSLVTRHSPVEVTGIDHVREVALGNSSTCASTSDGRVWCWGSNAFGQLANGTTGGRSSVPVQVAGVTDAVGVAAASASFCIAHTTGAVSCWGSNESGQLGDGTTTARTTPTRVLTLSTVTEVSSMSSAQHVCARTTDGSLWCWGQNLFGRLGDGTTENRTTPVHALSEVAHVGVGGQHSCAIVAGGSLRCWGYNQVGQLGDSSTEHRASPVPVAPPSG